MAFPLLFFTQKTSCGVTDTAPASSSMIAETGPRHRSRGRGGHAADAADPRPGQARRPVPWYLPPDRLRAVEHRHLRLPACRRPDPVQVAFAGQARRTDVADEFAAGQLCGTGAGSAAHGQALVPGQRRCDRAVAEPDL